MLNADSLNRTLFISDNLPVLRGIDSESVDLIATDPPFNKGVKAFEGIVTAGVDKKGKKVKYKDVWTWGDVQAEWTESIRQDHPNLYAVIQGANAGGGEDMGAFICWLAVRVLEMHRILKPTGSMYLHIDHTAHAYAKSMMDAIFGRPNFRNEIVWCYFGPSNTKRWFPRKHDVILFYAKSSTASFNREAVRVPYKILVGTAGGPIWGGESHNQARVDELREKGKVIEDYWTDIFPVVNQAEKTGYPTQKPLALYERIIKASSNPDDIVLDPFAGCATTCVAAEQLGRRWIAIDINKEARGVVLDRLRKEAQLPQGTQVWNREISVKTRPPKRTDDGKEAAPELVLVSPTPKGPRMTVRELRSKLAEEDGVMCQGCGYVPPQGLVEYLEVDHRHPRSKGGKDNIRNRVLLCPPCNGTKGNKLTLAELREQRLKEKRMLNKGWNKAWYEREGRFA